MLPRGTRRWLSTRAMLVALQTVAMFGCQRGMKLGEPGCKPPPNDKVSFVVHRATERNEQLYLDETGGLVVHLREGSPDRPTIEYAYVGLDLDPVPKTVAEPAHIRPVDSTGVAIFESVRPRKYGFGARGLFLHVPLRRVVEVRRGYIDTVDVTLARKPECRLGDHHPEGANRRIADS